MGNINLSGWTITHENCESMTFKNRMIRKNNITICECSDGTYIRAIGMNQWKNFTDLESAIKL